MAEAGRKLTIRMPDNPRLKTAVVKELHLDPGARVSIGSPVMTLSAKRKTHLVRSPKAGRVVPLVAPDDKISGGDPLYIINVETEPAPRAGEESRDLVPMEKRRWSPGMLADEIDPIDRARPRADDMSRFSRFAAVWGKPVLAVAIYVLACFVLLPILNLISRATTGAVPYMLLGLAVLFGFMLFYLYAPREGRWPRNSVRFIATSWVAMSAFALFYKPEEPTDISLADAGAPILAYFSEPEEQIAAVVPTETISPPAVTKSGVLVGIVPRAPGAQFVPRDVAMVDISTAPVPHGVTVREADRANPDNRAGEVLAFDQVDLVPAEQIPPVLIARANAEDAPLAEPLAFPDDLALAELVLEIPDEARILPGGPVPVPVAAEEAPAIAGAQIDEIAFAEASSETLEPETRLTSVQAPAEIADALPASGEALAALPTDPAWFTTTAVPVIASASAPQADLTDASYSGSRTSGGLVRPGPPSRLAPQTSPGILLLATLRSGESAWMAEQARLLAGYGIEGAGALASATAGPIPADAQVAALGTQVAGDAGGVISDTAGGAFDIERSPILVLRGGGAQAPELTDERAILNSADDPAQPSAASELRVAKADLTVPTIPVAESDRDLLAALEPVERVLLFLYFDDPRLGTHPRVGDTWLPAASLELRDAITEARVEAVREVVEVVAWCAAANDPGGAKAANLPGGAYRAALMTDRIRLLQVRVTLPGGALDALEQQLPVFGGAEPGFFHNRAPLMGGTVDEAVMDRARAWLAERSNRTADPNTPEGLAGGQYFDSADSAETALRGAGCEYVFWRDDPQPANEIGRELANRFDG